GAGSGDVPVSAILSGLLPGTTYFARVVASNSTGTTQGEIVSFTTLAPPVATTSPATDVTATGATLHGSADPRGHATTAAFVYGTDPDLATGTTTTVAQAVGSGAGAQAVSFALSGLEPGTTYYFQVLATGAGGSARGAILSFTTLAPSDVATEAATG